MKVTPRRDPQIAVPRPRAAVDGPVTRLEHGVAFHDSRDELLAQLVAPARAALDAGRTVALALAPDTERAVRAALGSTDEDSGVLVALPGPRPAEEGSGQSVALRRARELRELIAVSSAVSGAVSAAVTVLAEHRAEFDGPDGRFWTELEAAQHVALADLPVRLLCFYPELPLHLAVLDGARCTHPYLVVDGITGANPEYRRPREVLAGHPPAPPVLLGPPHHRLRFRPWQLREVRALVRDAATGAGFGLDRIDDAVLAVNEVATNAVEHGDRGEAELHLWCDPTVSTDGAVTVEVHDPGRLPDPLPGLTAPPAAEPRGRGLWIARQLSDPLHVWTDPSGTHVRLRCTR